MTKMRLPAEPVRSLIRDLLDKSDRGIYDVGRRIGVSGKTLERLFKDETVTVAIADRFCVAAGTHLAIVYGREYGQTA